MAINRMLRFSSPARRALHIAQREATLEDTALVDVRHLLIGMAVLPASDSTAAHVLRNVGLGVDVLRPTTRGENPTILQPELSDSVKRVIERATASAVQKGGKTISSAHLLYGLLDELEVGHLLAQAGVTSAQVRAALMSLDDWTNEG